MLLLTVHCALLQSPVWSIELLLRIGSLDREDYALSRVGGVAVGPDDQLFVAQPDERHIKVFDRAGAFVRRIGREGGGPGEFRSIAAIRFHAGRLRVRDVAGGRMTDFDANGRVLATHRAPAIRVEAPLYVEPPIAIAADGSRYIIPNSRGGRERIEEYPVFVADADGSVRQIGRVLHGGQTNRVQSGRWVAVVPSPVHTGTLYAVDHRTGDVIFVERPAATSRATHWWQLVRVTSAGDTVVHRKFDYAPALIDRGAVERERNRQIEITIAGNERARFPMPRADVEAIWERGYRVPRYQAPVDEILLGSTGEIWLRKGSFGEPRTEWIVLDAEGRLLGSLPLAANQTVAWASDRRIVLIEKDSLDVEYVSVHRLIRR